MMRPAEVEAWALRVLDHLRSGAPLEDSRVELKSGEVPLEKLARRLAGHANAARGDTILWLFGVNESGGVTNASLRDSADWWQQIAACFHGPVPTPIEARLFVDQCTILAVAFLTGQPPYVVWNPDRGRPNAGPIEREVPWREMTRVRSATHSDLVRVLVPLLQMPTLDVLSSSLLMHGPRDGFGDVQPAEAGRPCTWVFEMRVYVVAASYPFVVPAHRVSIEVNEQGTLGRQVFSSYHDLLTGEGPTRRREVDHVLNGPGRLTFTADYSTASLAGIPAQTAEAHIQFNPAGLDRATRISCTLERRGDTRFELAQSTTAIV